MHGTAIVIHCELQGSGRSVVCRAPMFARELQRSGNDAVTLFDVSGHASLRRLLDEGRRIATFQR